jgi:hypothetical protein
MAHHNSAAAKQALRTVFLVMDTNNTSDGPRRPSC